MRYFLLFTVFLIGFALVLTTPAQARGNGRVTDIALGKSEIVSIGSKAAEVLVSDPEIADAGTMRAGELHVTGKKAGDTNILVFDDNGKLLRKVNIHVHTDTDALQAAIDDAFPKSGVKVRATGTQIELSGTVADADTATKIRDLAGKFVPQGGTVVNRMTVAGKQQVMIRVKVVEVARTVLNELGIETNLSGFGKSGNFSGSSFGTASSMGLTIDPSFGTGSLIYNTGSTGPMELIMRALERDGLVNTLAQPNLTAISGENARFLAGGEFPIPSQRDQYGNIQYEYKPFGVSLGFKPVVLSDKRINLQIQTEVSEPSNELTLQLPGVTVPSFTVRRAETTVELASGGSLMIAGLIQSKSISGVNKLPGIGDIPVIGALSKSESFSRNESEMLVMITAYTVDPFADKQAQRVAPKPTQSPLNLKLVERMTATYGKEAAAQMKGGKPYGYILE